VSGTELDFPTADVDETCFESGAIIDSVPAEMILEAHSYMGQPGPYQQESDSDLAESDDEQIVAVLSDDKFSQEVKELIKFVINGQQTMETALLSV